MELLQLPDLKDAEAVQKFFLEEIQLGEELLAQGKPVLLTLTSLRLCVTLYSPYRSASALLPSDDPI